MKNYFLGKMVGHIFGIINLFVGAFALIGFTFICSDESDKVEIGSMTNSAVKNIRDWF